MMIEKYQPSYSDLITKNGYSHFEERFDSQKWALIRLIREDLNIWNEAYIFKETLPYSVYTACGK